MIFKFIKICYEKTRRAFRRRFWYEHPTSQHRPVNYTHAELCVSLKAVSWELGSRTLTEACQMSVATVK